MALEHANSATSDTRRLRLNRPRREHQRFPTIWSCMRSTCSPSLQVGHQAAMCPNGNTVNWRAVYGDDIFKLRPPVFESQLRELRKRKYVDIGDLERRAKEFAKV